MPPQYSHRQNHRSRSFRRDAKFHEERLQPRCDKQLGSTLIESPHRGEEVIGLVNGTTKTIDVMGHSSFYKNAKFNMSEFFDAIEHHVRKSNDWTAIDLKGASKEQIATITGYVNKMEEKFRSKIMFISP